MGDSVMERWSPKRGTVTEELSIAPKKETPTFVNLMFFVC